MSPEAKQDLEMRLRFSRVTLENIAAADTAIAESDFVEQLANTDIASLITTRTPRS